MQVGALWKIHDEDGIEEVMSNIRERAWEHRLKELIYIEWNRVMSKDAKTRTLYREGLHLA